MNLKVTWKRNAQLVAVVLCAAAVKLYYSTASVNELRWILGPTTVLVELVSGSRFEFESHAGYMNSEHNFVIAASCAGINFLITAFLMLTLRKLWRNRYPERSYNLDWKFIPAAALFAYLATLIANTVRISTALRLHGRRTEIGWLDPDQLHRVEGIFIYFGFLLLLFVVSEKTSSESAWGSDTASSSVKASDLFRRSLFPLLVYYATALGVPFANGAFRQGSAFWEHSLFVVLTPLFLILPLATLRIFRSQRGQVDCTRVQNRAR